MILEKTFPPMVRVSITLPPSLNDFAMEQAAENHFGNLSAYIRVLLQKAHREHVRRNGKTPQPALVA